MSAAVPFAKYEGLGNDFVVFELSEERLIPPERGAALCDRRFGVGGDGVLLSPSAAATAGCVAAA